MVEYQIKEASLRCHPWRRTLVLPAMRDDIAAELAGRCDLTEEGRLFLRETLALLVEATRRIDHLRRN